MATAKKPHAVCIPFPAQGHITPMLKLAKILHHRGFYITFVHTQFNYQRLLKSRGPDSLHGLPDFRFETIPDGLPPSNNLDATQDIVPLCVSTAKNCLVPFRQLLAKLNNASPSALDVPPVTCVVADGAMSFALEAAEEVGIPGVLFWVINACSFMCILQIPHLIERGFIPFKDASYLTNGYLDTIIDWIPGIKNIRLRDFPSQIRTTDPNDPIIGFALGELARAYKACAIILNTFDSLECDVLDSLSSMFNHVYTVGPLQLLLNQIPQDKTKPIGSNLWKEDPTCLEWLDSKEPNSVVYVNFGSLVVMSPQQLIEFAWGLANSMQTFLWIIRPDMVMGGSAILPPEFMTNIEKRGLIANWCPQEQVLNHPSVGGFLTHCGWNSIVESVCGGVPMICWPFFADHQTNCFYSCEYWEIGMEIDNDVKRDEVEKQVRELMEGEKGKEMKKRVMDSATARKPHAVCVPYPSQGHVTPMMQLAKLVHSRGFHVTFVNTEFNHRRLVRSFGPDSVKGLEDFRFETIPDGLPPSDRDATQDVPALCDSTRKNCLGPFRELLDKLNSSEDVPPVSCIISDGVMSFGIKAAEELGIPEVQLWTASACGFMGYLHFSELFKRGLLPFQLDENMIHHGTLNTPIDWIPGMPNIRLKDIPNYVGFTDPDNIMYDFMGSEAHNCLQAPAIIFNTFDTFEQEVLEAIRSKFPNIYTAGPLTLLQRHMPNGQSESLKSSLWKEDTKCLDWLHKREPNSVVYVNYGSVTVMTDQHLIEFAWGLANSKHPFLWIVRPDIVMGDSAILPQEFFEETKDRGLLASWCPQDQVLSHPSVGVFLTHGGWNSILESICGGVPVICWPFFAEQHTNCRYACTVWGIGMEVNHDVKRDEIENIVREMMEGEKGKQMKKSAREWKREAEEATDVGGSSYNNFERFIKEALHHNENFVTDGTLDTPIDWIPGMSNIRLKDIPTQIRTTDPNDFLLNFIAEEAQNCLKASAIIINTFETIEHEVLAAIKTMATRIYAIGPLSSLGRHMPNNKVKSFR
ncbi:hypothetical protein L1049_024237 [Liquidambar formosana]|uniref:Uncharacterized protein n=1 Tax=Liquidambar formosana TaxID=63359 RepID=A0AAP0X4F0_LIQFO